MSLRILFFGTSEFAAPSLTRLAKAGHPIVRCVTQPDRPQGRGLMLRPSPVKVAAQALRVPVEEPETLRPRIDEWRALRPDLGVAIAYGKILPREVLEVPRHGMLGVHPSMLPRYRGANPIAWAILDGLDATGVTIFRLNERMDAGEIALQRPTPIHPEDTTESLSKRLAEVGADWLAETVERIERGDATWQPQDDRGATLARKFTKEDGRIAWTDPADRIARVIRAACPWPGAYTTWRGELLKLWAARPDGAASSAAPGSVARVSDEGVRVATGRGTVLLTEMQRPGGRRLSAREFLKGHAIAVGDVLGGGPNA